MISIKGKVGPWSLDWKKAPSGNEGVANVEVQGVGAVEVRWRRDKEGIWLELPNGVYGFDIDAEMNDEGKISYWLVQRFSDQQWAGLSFNRAGDEISAVAAGGQKKGVRIKAQMPGKIIRVMVEKGAEVEKGQPLALMEAMKMENEIRSPQAGRIQKVSISQGQALETGAELFVVEPV